MAKKSTISPVQEFEITLSHAQFASEQLWQIFEIFVLAHTILIGLLGAALSQGVTSHNKLYLALVLSMGLIMCVMWLGAYLRTRNYYEFRIAQTRAIKVPIKLFNQGKDYSEGKKVVIDGKAYQMNFLGNWLKMSTTMPLFILLFGVLYALLLINVFNS